MHGSEAAGRQRAAPRILADSARRLHRAVARQSHPYNGHHMQAWKELGGTIAMAYPM